MLPSAMVGRYHSRRRHLRRTSADERVAEKLPRAASESAPSPTGVEFSPAPPTTRLTSAAAVTLSGTRRNGGRQLPWHSPNRTKRRVQIEDVESGVIVSFLFLYR